MATRLTGKSVSLLAARNLFKVPKNSFHPSIPRKPLAVPWHLDNTDNETAHQNEADEVEWGNVETFGGSSLCSLGEYMLPMPLEGLDQVEKLSQLRFHHFEEVRDHFGVKSTKYSPGEKAFTGSSSWIHDGKCQHLRSAASDHYLGGGDIETKRGPDDRWT